LYQIVPQLSKGELYGDDTHLAQQAQEHREHGSGWAQAGPNGILCKLSAIATMNQWWAEPERNMRMPKGMKNGSLEMCCTLCGAKIVAIVKLICWLMSAA